MGKFNDLTGKRFGNLTVIKREKNENGYVRWKCRCDCGKETVVRAGNLTSGAVKSCGCLKHVGYHTTHSMSKTRLYKTWCNMRRRCYDKNIRSYKNYGKRGICVCDEWRDSFEPFQKWANETGYTDEMTIERMDLNGNYCPENCKWIPMPEQANNRRINRNITYNGETHNLSEWCKILNLRYPLIHNRIKKLGMTFEDAIKMPLMAKKRNKEARKKYG